jgi:OOP family OmpA-OmpF porin
MRRLGIDSCLPRSAWFGVALLGATLAGGCFGVDGERSGELDPVSPATSELTRTFAASSLIIPLDAASQGAGALRAYGLVYELLRHNVPVHWAIQMGKTPGGVDVTIDAPAAVGDLQTGAAIALPVNYAGGPFLIDAADREAALPIIQAWFGNPLGVTVVHTVTAGTFTANIARTLVAAPRVAVLQDGNELIAFKVFRQAGILDSRDQDWPNDSPDLLTQDAIASQSPDRGLFDAAGDSKYCHLTSMHYNSTDATTTSKVVSEVRRWLTGIQGNHAYMQCQAIATFENDSMGRFLTKMGIVPQTSAPNPLTNLAAYDPLTQADAALEGVPGAVGSMTLVTGSTLWPGVDKLVSGAGGEFWLMSGPLQGDVANGKVTYLGGHDYLSISKPNSTKVLLDSLFASGCASMTTGVGAIQLTKTSPEFTTEDRITYKIEYTNTGTAAAKSVTITDPLPAGATFIEASGGGTNAAGTVTWVIGDLAPGASGDVTVTVGVTADGEYTNTAVARFTSGGTNRTAPKSSSTTIRDTQDVDGDGVPDRLDNCPAMLNADQLDKNRDGVGDLCQLGVSGGGCQTGGGGLGIGVACVLGALALLRRRRRGAVVLVLALGAGAALPRSASAQVMEPRSFGVERFRLSSGRDGMFDVESGEVRGHMAITAALWAGLANDPLVLYAGEPGDRVGSLVATRSGGSLSASISPNRWLQIGFDLPLVIYQDRPASSVIAPMGLESLHSFGTSNLRVSPKVVVLRQADHGVSLAVIPTLILPTRSSSDTYFDDKGFAFAPELALSRRWTGWRAGVNAGYHARERATFLNQVVDDELFAHAGVGYQFADRGGPPLGIDVTMSGATAARAPVDNFNENHLETLVGATYDLAGGAQLFGGGGAGLRKGYGTPDWRGLVGVRLGFGGDPRPAPPRREPVPEPVLDRDHDGVLDAEDRCIDVPGPAALGGCPDSDGDGLVDVDDKCPTEAEDLDSFEDGDGCPELDNDKDGVPDAADTCPLQAGPAENNGCPDADRDGDGVVDRLDKCPDEKGLAKDAGCPAVSIDTEGGVLKVLESVYFKTDRAEIQPVSFPVLDDVAAALKTHDKLRIQVEGHTDSQGDNNYNKQLSQRRTESVVAYLVQKGIDRSRLVAKGFGEEQPIADNNTDEGRAKNRRVVFTILSGGDGVKVRPPSGPSN